MDSLRCKKEERGKVLKDGLTYVKSAKVRRFGSRHKRLLAAALMALAGAGVCLGAIARLEHASAAPHPEAPVVAE